MREMRKMRERWDRWERDEIDERKRERERKREGANNDDTIPLLSKLKYNIQQLQPQVNPPGKKRARCTDTQREPRLPLSFGISKLLWL